jgi:RNA polymerase sigma-70 factor, ECF subfamily
MPRFRARPVTFRRREPITPERMLSLTQANAGHISEVSAVVQPIAALAAHDPGAWQQLFDEYYRKMYSFAYVRTGDTTAAEDIAAEVFIAAAKGIATYKPTGAPFASWLYRIARNLTADHLERLRRRPAVSLDTVELASNAWDAGIDDATDIAQALTHLTKEQQEVIVLRFFNDCSLQDAAEAMGKNVGAIKLLQHRALAAMRRQMRPSTVSRQGGPKS